MIGRKRRGDRRRIAVVTGTRAEFGLLGSTLRALRDHPKVQLQLVVTGTHLLTKFGRTEKQILGQGWSIAARVKMQTGRDDPLDQARGLGRGVRGIAEFLEAADIDIVVVLGDRIEAMAGALAGVTTGRIVAHIHGGDVAPGDFDDALRHSITKLAHIHLAATQQAARRIVRMGERPDQVHVVGAPGLDDLCALIRNDADASPVTSRRFGRSNGHSRTAMIIHHPIGRAPAREERSMAAVLRAVRKRGFRATIVYPNSDRGHSGIMAAIRSAQTRARNGQMRVCPALERTTFLRQLMAADLLVGNSSAGIIEAPIAGTPAVNVGSRQKGRLRAGPSVIDCDESARSIESAMIRAQRLRPRLGRAGCYGIGHAGVRIAEVLIRTRISDPFRRKPITY